MEGPGVGMEVRPAENYIAVGEALNFLQLAKRVQDDDQILVGYQQVYRSS